MKDPTVDSHACHRAKSGDPSDGSHPSLPQRSMGDMAAAARALSRQFTSEGAVHYRQHWSQLVVVLSPSKSWEYHKRSFVGSL